METSPVVANYLRYAVTGVGGSRSDEAALVARARRGEPAAVDELARRHLAFVIRVAMEFRGRGVPFEDLVNEGCVGLLKAIRRYNADHGTRFMTYAAFWMRKSMLDALLEQPRMVRVPRYQLAKRVAIPREVRLDAPIDAGEALTWGERLADPRAPHTGAALIEDQTITRLQVALAALPPREREVIASRFGLDGRPALTLLAVGAQLQLSRERVRQIETAALARLRRALERDQAPLGHRFAPSRV
jgi:RNA polymerase sigma factor (sigma-70 family)